MSPDISKWRLGPSDRGGYQRLDIRPRQDISGRDPKEAGLVASTIEYQWASRATNSLPSFMTATAARPIPMFAAWTRRMSAIKGSN